MAGSRGPSSRFSPARSARPCRVASGTVTSGSTGPAPGRADRRAVVAVPGPEPPPGSSPSPGSFAAARVPVAAVAPAAAAGAAARIPAVAVGSPPSGSCAVRVPAVTGPGRRPRRALSGRFRGGGAGERDRVVGGHAVEQVQVGQRLQALPVWPGNAPDASYCPARATTLACPASACAAGRSRPDRPTAPDSSRNTVTRARSRSASTAAAPPRPGPPPARPARPAAPPGSRSSPPAPPGSAPRPGPPRPRPAARTSPR